MFENQNAKTELMIVCDEKLMEYANYLMALIGQNDDVDGQVVGLDLSTCDCINCSAQCPNGKKGIVKNPKDRINAVKSVVSFAESFGFGCFGVFESAITGGDGNIEFLAYFKRN